MRNLPVLLVSLIILAWLPTAQAAEVLRKISWSELEKSGQLAAGEVLPADPPKEGHILKIENEKNEPKQVQLLELNSPGITGPAYAIRGQVRYENVKGKGFLEMWNHFPDGGFYFSRTLGEIGPMKHLEGTSDWRDFTLPFFINQGDVRPDRLVINLVFEGSGTIYLGPLQLEQYADMPAAMKAFKGWWDAWTGWLISGILVVVLVCLGIATGVLVRRGRGRGFVMAVTAATALLGMALLGAGAAALVAAQPAEVWFPLLLGGGLGAGMFGAFRPIIRKRYDQMELEQISAMDLGKGSP